MKKKYKLPYGESNFGNIVRQGYYYVDRTPYIERLESLGERYLFFLRPRRFGKTLLLSVLQHYYGKGHKDDFGTLFGDYYIGKNPTPKAGKYLVLRFDFSGVNTESKETTYNGFLKKVKDGIREMHKSYPGALSEKDYNRIIAETAPNLVLLDLITTVQGKRLPEKIYVLIDEYDHFTNELLAFRLKGFKEIVSQNGYVRKFFEILKQGTGKGIVDRIFITGVSPITLDSLTSGFNIGMNLSRDFRFAEMLGFTEKEVANYLKISGVEEHQVSHSTMLELEKWYNGYRFHESAENQMYNSGMVLYFCSKYQAMNKFPKEMLDTNLSSDYGKLRRMFDIQSPDRNYATLREIVENKKTSGTMTAQFSFEKPFSRDDFISLLYYLGHLTIESAWANIYTYKIPNFVIERLFYDYFLHLLEQREELPVQSQILQRSVRQMALENDPRPFFEYVQTLLQHLSNRDYREFSEKHLKVIIFTLALQTDAYFVKSEREVKGGYTDLQFLARPAVPVNSEYVFELKYLPQKEAQQLKAIQQEAKAQLLGYIKAGAVLDSLDDLQGWTVVVVKDEVHLEKVYGAVG